MSAGRAVSKQPCFNALIARTGSPTAAPAGHSPEVGSMTGEKCLSFGTGGRGQMGGRALAVGASGMEPICCDGGKTA